MVERTIRRPPLRLVEQWGEVIPWHGDVRVAHIVPNEVARPDPASVRSVITRLRRAGYEQVVTSALLPSSALAFLDAGFVVRERLHLLEHPLDQLPSSPPSARGRSLRRGRRVDRHPVLALDALAFDDFWQLDEYAFRGALDATPSTRFRVGGRLGRVTAYAITGRAGPRGYLQRVAVHPDEQGKGWGRSLVVDALAWLSRHGARRAYVNTLWENHAALSLYESSGFHRSLAAMCVLEFEL